MKNKDAVILRKILDYCRQCEEAVDMFGGSFDTFCACSVFQNACCMCILQIGELCKNVSLELRKMAIDIPWKEWCGVRDIFAHQYSNIDFESAWETIQKDLPELAKENEELQRRNNYKEVE